MYTTFSYDTGPLLLYTQHSYIAAWTKTSQLNTYDNS